MRRSSRPARSPTTVSSPVSPSIVCPLRTRSRVSNAGSSPSSRSNGLGSRSSTPTWRPSASSPSEPGRRSGNWFASRSSVRIARRPSKASGARVVPIGRGRSASENATTTSATSTGTNAVR
jgi:hypothetical protein